MVPNSWRWRTDVTAMRDCFALFGVATPIGIINDWATAATVFAAVLPAVTAVLARERPE